MSFSSDTDENYLKWIAPSKYGTTHGAELIHEFGAYKNENYGEPFAWEYEAGEAFGSRINAIVNSDYTLSDFEWQDFAYQESLNVIKNTATNIVHSFEKGTAFEIKSEYGIRGWKEFGNCKLNCESLHIQCISFCESDDFNCLSNCNRDLETCYNKCD